MTYRTTLGIALALSLVAAGTTLADTIALRGAVRLAPDVDHVRLGDIAELEGENAATFGDLLIAPSPSAGDVLEISVSQVRAALDEAGVHWGRTHLNGRQVVVRAAGRSGGAPRAMAPVVLESNKEPSRARRESTAQLASELLASANLRSAVAEFMAKSLDVQPQRLRLTFDPRDAALLDSSLTERRFEIDAVSSTRSARVDLAIRVWQGDRIIERRTISFTSAIQMPVAVVTRDLDRGGVVSKNDIELIEQWHAPSSAGTGLVHELEDVLGRTLATRLREGDLLRPAHLQRETLVRRGELVTVRCIVGGAVISLQAEARASASEGETIEFRKPGERDTFLATVTGRGAAVIDLASRRQ